MYATRSRSKGSGRGTRGPESVSDRLEQVRSRVTVETLRDFWRALVDDTPYQVSYEAVRNYHSDRDPPVGYLVRVAEVFGVDLHWLATGRGAPFPADLSVNRVADAAARDGSRMQEFEVGLSEVFRLYEKLPPLAAAMALKTCERLYRDAHFRARLDKKAGPSRTYVGRFVGKALAGPLVNAVAGTVRTSELHVWQIESYVLGICQALTALIPNPHFTETRFEEQLH